jgi:hypothetical protein
VQQQPPVQYSMPLSVVTGGGPPPGHGPVMSGAAMMAYAGPPMYHDPDLAMSMAKQPRKNMRATMVSLRGFEAPV